MRGGVRPVLVGKAHEAAVGGDGNGFGAVVRAELGEDGSHVELDRPLADKQPLGDLGILEAAGQVGQYFELAGREVARVLSAAVYALQEAVRDGRLQERAAGVDGADG